MSVSTDHLSDVVDNYTALDLKQADAYAKDQVNRTYLNLLGEKYPHIGTHLEYKDGKIVITDKLLQQLACHPFKQGGVRCKVDDPAHWIRIGEQTFTQACEPACYNLSSTVQFNEDHEPLPQMPTLIRKGATVQVKNPTYLFFEYPEMRSTDKSDRERRMPCGFDLTADGRYRVNATYCRAFGGVYNPADEDCHSIAPILGWVLGADVLFRYMRVGFDFASKEIKLDPSALPIPTEPKPQTVDEWKADINTAWKKYDVAPLDVQQAPDQDEYRLDGGNDEQSLRRGKRSTPSGIKTAWVGGDIPEYVDEDAEPADPNDKRTEPEKLVYKSLNGIYEFIVQLGESLGTVEFWRDLIGQRIIFAQTQLWAGKLMEFLNTAFAKNALQTLINQSLIRVAASQAIRETVKRAVAELILTSVAAVVKSVSRAFSIGTVIIGLVNLYLSAADPWQLTKGMTKETVQKIQDTFDEKFFRNHSERMEISPVLLANIILTPDEYQLASFNYATHFYNFLIVKKFNSDGVPIVRKDRLAQYSRSLNAAERPVWHETERAQIDGTVFRKRLMTFDGLKYSIYGVTAFLIISLVYRFTLGILLSTLCLWFLVFLSYLNISEDVATKITNITDNFNLFFQNFK